MDEEDGLVVDSREDLARLVRSRRKEATERRNYVRFGAWSGASRRGLDAEFLVTSEGGAWDPHMSESGARVTRYEAGVSVYFAYPAEDNSGWHMVEPSRRRALYGLQPNYMGYMAQNIFLEAMCKDEVWLITAKPVVVRERVSAYIEDDRRYAEVTLMDYETGADGEPVVSDIEIVTQLDVWGDRSDLPRLYLGYPSERRIEFIDAVVRSQSAFGPRLSRDRREPCSRFDEEEPLDPQPR
jgi:hypothetical protein